MSLYLLAALVPALAQFVLFIRWLYRRMRDDELQRVFVRDMATNHLPHIYDALRHLAHKFQVELPDPPPTHYVAIDGNRRAPRRDFSDPSLL